MAGRCVVIFERESTIEMWVGLAEQLYERKDAVDDGRIDPATGRPQPLGTWNPTAELTVAYRGPIQKLRLPRADDVVAAVRALADQARIVAAGRGSWSYGEAEIGEIRQAPEPAGDASPEEIIEHQAAQLQALRAALIMHRLNLHSFTRQPCVTCHASAVALGIAGAVPDHCASPYHDIEELRALGIEVAR